MWFNGSPRADRVTLFLKKISVHFGMQKTTAKQGKADLLLVRAAFSGVKLPGIHPRSEGEQN